MIEAWKIPILKASLEFLFDVGRTVLEDITRQRKMNAGDTSDDQPDNATHPVDVVHENENTLTTKQDALNIKIEEARVKRYETEITHLLELAEINQKNYQQAQKKMAMWTETLAPPIVRHELELAQSELEKTTNLLQTKLEEVIGKSISIN